jgi:hypothetical protein
MINMMTMFRYFHQSIHILEYSKGREYKQEKTMQSKGSLDLLLLISTGTYQNLHLIEKLLQ